VVAVGVLQVRLHRGEVVALTAMVIGLILLAVSAQPGPARALSRTGQWALLASVPVVAAVATVSARRNTRTATLLLAGLAGAAFGGVGIAARGLHLAHPVWRAISTPAAWSVVAFGVLAALLFGTALQRGSVTVTAAAVAATETILPSIIGLTVLGDKTQPGAGAAAAAVGFALTLAGAIGLAPYAHPVATKINPDPRTSRS